MIGKTTVYEDATNSLYVLRATGLAYAQRNNASTHSIRTENHSEFSIHQICSVP